MRFTVLGSGSRGNAVYIESAQTAILLDAGFSGKEIGVRLTAAGLDIEALDGILLTHEHNDHICGAGVVSRRCRVPVMANAGTFRGGDGRIGRPHGRREFATGETFVFQDLQIRSFPLLHDTRDPVGFVISDGRFSLGYCTDTGKTTQLMTARLCNCDALIIEFNHDPEMLRKGPYPPALQQRVRSSYGHLANGDAAAFLGRLANDRLQCVVLAHLSETNNSPAIAYAAARQAGLGEHVTLVLASQDRVGAGIDLSARSEPVV